MDVSLTSGQSMFYEIVPYVSGRYDIFTSPYGGTGDNNDTYLELYSDSGLTNHIAYNDDYSRILQSLILVDGWNDVLCKTTSLSFG